MFFGLSCLYIHLCILILKILPSIFWEESESFHVLGAQIPGHVHCVLEDKETRLQCYYILCALPRSALAQIHKLFSSFYNQRSCGCRTNTRINVMICVVHSQPSTLPNPPPLSLPPPHPPTQYCCSLGRTNILQSLVCKYQSFSSWTFTLCDT